MKKAAAKKAEAEKAKKAEARRLREAIKAEVSAYARDGVCELEFAIADKAGITATEVIRVFNALQTIAYHDLQIKGEFVIPELATLILKKTRATAAGWRGPKPPKMVLTAFPNVALDMVLTGGCLGRARAAGLDVEGWEGSGHRLARARDQQQSDP